MDVHVLPDKDTLAACPDPGVRQVTVQGDVSKAGGPDEGTEACQPVTAGGAIDRTEDRIRREDISGSVARENGRACQIQGWIDQVDSILPVSRVCAAEDVRAAGLDDNAIRSVVGGCDTCQEYIAAGVDIRSNRLIVIEDDTAERSISTTDDLQAFSYGYRGIICLGIAERTAGNGHLACGSQLTAEKHVAYGIGIVDEDVGQGIDLQAVSVELGSTIGIQDFSAVIVEGAVRDRDSAYCIDLGAEQTVIAGFHIAEGYVRAAGDEQPGVIDKARIVGGVGIEDAVRNENISTGIQIGAPQEVVIAGYIRDHDHIGCDHLQTIAIEDHLAVLVIHVLGAVEEAAAYGHLPAGIDIHTNFTVVIGQDAREGCRSAVVDIKAQILPAVLGRRWIAKTAVEHVDISASRDEGAAPQVLLEARVADIDIVIGICPGIQLRARAWEGDDVHILELDIVLRIKDETVHIIIPARDAGALDGDILDDQRSAPGIGRRTDQDRCIDKDSRGGRIDGIGGGVPPTGHRQIRTVDVVEIIGGRVEVNDIARIAPQGFTLLNVDGTGSLIGCISWKERQ